MPVTSFHSAPDEGGVSMTLVGEAGELIFAADIPAEAFEDVRGDGTQFSFRDDDGAVPDANGLRSVLVTIRNDSARVNVVGKAVDLQNASAQTAVTLVIVVGGDTDGDCLTGLDLACSSTDTSLKCGN